jgi:hypothetical protein
MSVMVEELYTVLRRIPGITDEEARAASRAVLSIEHSGQLATKEDVGLVKEDVARVRAELAAAETRIIKWNVGAMGLLTVIYGAINVLLRVL